MTTTLRPAAPLQHEPDGTVRPRPYDICVNGRTVGSLSVGTAPGMGPTVGFLDGLTVQEADRGRGRATVALLAAEEVLRGWGCTQARCTVPADAGPALRLATALGWTEGGRNMVKTLPPTPPPLPAGVTARPMTEGEYAQWETASREAYAQEWANRGLPEEQARARSEASYRDNLSQGLATPGVTFGVVEADGAPAGHVWVSSGQAGPGVPGAYVFDIEVRPEFRGRGLGRALMLLAERAAFDTGDSLIGLHVFADNTPARRLYDSLGYTPTRLHWSKPL
ncbi:GNAT family N-acetyltransferase [Streptomyces albidoflavus]|uniref:GNAT family N-acetyltransferase n=1 Tax=Streptomyces albidoflavus TaxID=1886 RepID=UPI00101E546B|nr:GNAT family N-acetyltransferase [Streptomyces albidoflavus]RZE87479.1 GNAT family N-acetyltransferase [Streptomyces albidoflavus]RZE88858.1 GNAT family N-acetyltransferase [Streptomyces albidoflavus]